MKSLIKTVLLFGIVAIVIAVIVIQFVPYGGSRLNPPVFAEPEWDSPRTRELFFRACGDCHSNETVWPWYTNIAPVSWLVIKDVQEGRASFNVSEWGRQENEAEEAAEAVQEGKMPLSNYLLMHPGARLSPPEKREFITALIATFGGDRGESEESESGEDD